MQEFLVKLFGEFWSTLFMSVLPLIELKGGIIYARSIGYGFFTAFGLSYLGSSLAFFLVFFLFKPILSLLKKIKAVDKFAYKVEEYFNKKAQTTLDGQTKSKKRKNLSETALKMLGVGLFVAIPLPMTGVWAGTAIAVFLGLGFTEALLPVVTGNFVAGIIISLLGELCIRVWSLESLNIVLWIFFGLAIILTVVTVVRIMSSKKAENVKVEEKDGNTNENGVDKL